VSVPQEGVLLYRRRGEEERMNLDAADQCIRITTRHAHGAASERARVARPSPFTNFTSGPPLVHPLS
jgi:hypothetical protein